MIKHFLAIIAFTLEATMCPGQANCLPNELSLHQQTEDYLGKILVDSTGVSARFKTAEFSLNFDDRVWAKIGGRDYCFLGRVFKFVSAPGTWIGISKYGDYVKLSECKAEVELDGEYMVFME